MLRFARVTTNGFPIGRHPCETTDRMETGPPTTTPTLPWSYSPSFTNNRFSPGADAPLAIPPKTGSPGNSAPKCASIESTEQENGSPSRNAARGDEVAASAEGAPVANNPSRVRSNAI